ncbi:hypothetical protein VTK56DRAFT_9244 [Thermocarpiscus australiensis]
MPFRYSISGAALHRLSDQRIPIITQSSVRCQRFFHASPRALQHADSSGSATNHYETLNVHPDASPAEIKRSFYLLSKRHHPDHNPSDPHAPSRFMRISEAYAVLGHADKRARYDRDVMTRLRGTNHHHHHRPPHKGSSYHSTGPAGGRPASGLSSRRSSSSRGTYQGPPPSFFRAGGWGAHGAKRRAAHEESTGFGAGFGTNSSPGPGGSSGAGSGGGPPPPPPPGGVGAGGMGPGQDPFGHREDVPHFDRVAHERAQRRADELRARRMAERRGVRIDPEPGTTGFLGVTAILAVVVMAPFIISGWINRNSSTPAMEREREREKEKRPR